MRPKFLSPEGVVRANLPLQNLRREEADLMEDSEDTSVPEFNRLLESESYPMALKVSADRARASTRSAPWGDPTHADVGDSVDFGEEGPRICARQGGGAR